ncbi:NlpC/P60 family protein [Azospirillum canadense]|uniref:NlpC/P60 family protein n=1 Tax=Azospirillum canadense TaxID=403962 RepID=UPI002225F194|nr:NlpC/P60 family protein [Azospirillum canadense]MCW2242271.1 proteasome lid subunit RPN8/RPN11 [Azospirillum canadense]
MILDPAVISAAKAHAVAEHPRESCGLVTAAGYVPCRNVHPDPLDHFEIAPEELLRDDVRAVLHSHIAERHDPWPSQGDMGQQIAMDVPWGIIVTDGVGALDPILWGDFLLDTPLVGRPFVHGVTDCYALIRAYYHQERGVTLPDHARTYEWWTAGENHYLDHFARHGFRVIDAGEARPGDGFLAQVLSPVPNHAGVLIEDGLVLHHLDRRLSRREPAFPWKRHITHWMRLEA